MTKNFKFNEGYTLIELTIVMVILLVVGGMIVGIMTSALRGSTKTKITNDIAQNGNYALSVITNIVTNAQEFESLNSISPVTGVLTSCDAYTLSLTPTPGPFIGDKISVKGFDGGITTFSCENGTISSNSASLLNVSQVRTTFCQFKCTQTSIYTPPRIDIEFDLTNVSGQTLESQAGANFRTSVSLRNRSFK